MSSEINTRIIILWEDEIRKAAQLLIAAREELDEAKVSEAMMAAYAACETALTGITNDSALLMMANRDLQEALKKRAGLV